MSFQLLSKAVNTTTTAAKTAIVAIDRFGKQKSDYQAYLDKFGKIITVAGTGTGYINQLSWLIDMQDAAFARGDFRAGFKWANDISTLVAQINVWFRMVGYGAKQFNLKDFENFKKMGGKPETAGGGTNVITPQTGSGVATGSGSQFSAGTSNGTLP